jgi:hypothetical protein
MDQLRLDAAASQLALFRRFLQNQLTLMIQLILAQNAAHSVLRYALDAGNLLLLSSASGRGRTTVLKKLHEDTGGGFINSKDFIEGSAERKRLVEDSKAFYVFDRANGPTLRTANEYFTEAANAVRENKQRYDRTEAAAQRRARTARRYYPAVPEIEGD